MAKLILLIGLPGSGKSTLARRLQLEHPDRKLVSTDAIRAQFFGDEAIQGPWLKVWAEVQRQLQEFAAVAPTMGEVVYDATNAACKQRREVLTIAREAGFTYITGIWLHTPLEICLERNRSRSRQVPKEVILHMHRQLTDVPPSITEDLDEIRILQSPERNSMG
ncbi:MAG: AAA family ATPase [Leptolyngbyaceae cyanobacterium bins.59]|nr:AAA family ATPase [Leptolyngbyaceae cyanobacterium bins.59]